MAISEQEFTAIYQTHWKALYYQAMKHTDDEELAKELIQDLFRQMWERREHIAIESSPAAYLRGALRLKVFEHYRNLARRKPELPAPAQEPQFCLNEYLDGKEASMLVERAVRDMTPRCREVFVLSRQEGLSNKVIAAQLGISVKAVEANITRALSILRHTISKFL